MLAFDQGDLAAASAHCEYAAPLWRALLGYGEPDKEAHRFLVMTLGAWSAPLHAQGDRRAPAVMAELFALLPALDDPHAQATSTIRYAQRLLEAGDLAAAKRLLHEGLVLFRTLGDTWSIAEAVIARGSVALWEHDVVGARSSFAEGLALARAVGDRTMQAWALNNLGEAARLGGDDAVAAEHYTASLQLYHDIDNRGDSPRLLHNLGYVALHRGDLALARARFRESLTGFRATGTQRGMVEAIAGLAAVAAATGTSPEALLAAELWGAADAAHQTEGILVWPADRAERERYETMARTIAGSHAFDAAYTGGSMRTIEQAMATALAV
jgi:tetratricopeptide (TPR) repeat protein